MSNVLKMLSRGGAAAAETDPNFKQTVLLLHGDGTNGAQNNTFLDSSSNNFTITRNPATGPNAPTQGTFSPFSVGAGEWSNYFGSTTGYLSIPTSTALDISTGAFTIEMWVYPLSGTFGHLAFRRAVQTARGFILYYDFSTKQFVFFAGDTNNSAWEVSLTSANTYNSNQWIHVAITRDSSNNFTLWVNGTSQATGNSSVTIADASSNLLINAADGGTVNGNNYISNWRLVKGRAVYTSNFTPSTTPLGATSGGQNPPQGTETSLLTCQSNRFVDNSTNAFAITRNGDVRVTPFSPFAPTAAYSAGTNGGSGYFDGTGDYLSLPTSQQIVPATGDLTIEGWFYPTSLSADAFLYTQTNGGASAGRLNFYVGSTGTLNFQVGSSSYTGTSGVIRVGQWNHLAVTRTGTSVAFYANGATAGSGTVSGTIDTGSSITDINRSANATTSTVPGYYGSFRISDNVRSSLTTVPTSPFTSDGNTKLLLNFTNAGIIDNTGKNNLETVGNAQIDTTTKKFGTGSMEFDGTGDYLVAPSNSELILSGDFTIECWAYRSASGSYRLFTLGDSVGTSGIEIYVSGTPTGTWVVYSNNATRITGSSATREVWTYLALVRSGSTVTLYVDGTSSGSTWSSTATFSGRFFVGAEFYNNTVTADTNGFIDDLRITKGVARYPTEPFPTKAFPDL